MQFAIVYVTAADMSEAKRIGRTLVEERLAACANCFAGMQSVYRWEGKLEEGTEAVLIAKTRSSLVEAVVERVRKLHSYAVPCVVSWPIAQANPEYLEWLEQNTQEQ